MSFHGWNQICYVHSCLLHSLRKYEKTIDSRAYSDLSWQIKEPQNAIYCLNFFKKRQHFNHLPPDKSNAFWLEHLSYFDRCCSRLTITCATKVPREQNQTSRRGQALQLLKIVCDSLDDDTLYSHWSDSVMSLPGAESVRLGLFRFNSAPTDESRETTTQDHIILNK